MRAWTVAPILWVIFVVGTFYAYVLQLPYREYPGVEYHGFLLPPDYLEPGKPLSIRRTG